MNLAQTLFFASLLVFIVNFFLYVNEVLNHRVGRFTTWKELTKPQWVFVVGTFQFPVVAFVLLLSRIL